MAIQTPTTCVDVQAYHENRLLPESLQMPTIHNNKFVSVHLCIMKPTEIMENNNY